MGTRVRVVGVDVPSLILWQQARKAQTRPRCRERTTLPECFKLRIRLGSTTTNPVLRLEPSEASPGGRYINDSDFAMVCPRRQSCRQR